VPIYEFECANCRKRFEELFRSSSDVKAPPCPKCKGRKTRRLLSVFGMGGGSRSSGGGSSCGSCSRGSCAGCKR
jgi:putative FmdB family regulatory protein